MELGPYVLGSWLGMLPGTYAYVNAGVAGRAVVMDGGEAMSLDPLQVCTGCRFATGGIGGLNFKAGTWVVKRHKVQTCLQGTAFHPVLQCI